MTNVKTNRRRRRDASFDPDEAVVLGELVDVHTPGVPATAVIMVRVPRDLLSRMSEYGQRRGITVGEVLTEGAELLVGAPDDPPMEPD